MISRKTRLALSLILSPFVVLCTASLAIVLTGLNDNLHAADLAVVLGSKVNPDGKPSLMLKARLDHAIALYRQGYFKLVLVSGGLGREGYDEASVMRDYLAAHGISRDAILVDSEGNTTWMTAKNTARIMSERHLSSVLIVSQYFHIARCRLAFKRFGIAKIYTSHATFWSIRDLYSIPREAVGFADYVLRQTDSKDTAREFD